MWRKFRTIGVLGILGLVVACQGGPGGMRLPGEAPALHRQAIVIDTHADTTPYFEDPTWDFLERHAASESHLDLPRMREGGLDAQFWSIYMPKREGDGRAIREALQRIDAVRELARRHPEAIELATTASELRAAVGRGKLASLMGIEGGHIIENQLAMLRVYHALGVRYLTLTHSFHTDWADSSGTTTVPRPVHGGLTDFGREVVLEMNRLGMMVDVSHVSDATFWDVIETTRAPVLASHSSCRAVAGHQRNLTDEMLRAVAANGGVVMINFFSGYIDLEAGAAIKAHSDRLAPQFKEIRSQPDLDFVSRVRASKKISAQDPYPQTTLSVLLDHFDHAIAVAGANHVGLGSDWDGVPSMPEGLEDVTGLPALTAGLLERGHSPETVVKVLGENVLRVMQANEETARGLADAL